MTRTRHASPRSILFAALLALHAPLVHAGSEHSRREPSATVGSHTEHGARTPTGTSVRVGAARSGLSRWQRAGIAAGIGLGARAVYRRVFARQRNEARLKRAMGTALGGAALAAYGVAQLKWPEIQIHEPLVRALAQPKLVLPVGAVLAGHGVANTVGALRAKLAYRTARPLSAAREVRKWQRRENAYLGGFLGGFGGVVGLVTNLDKFLGSVSPTHTTPVYLVGTAIMVGSVGAIASGFKSMSAHVKVVHAQRRLAAEQR